jgi:hypothetical protein
MGKVDNKQMDLAIDAYLKGSMSIREAAKAYDVAKSSLSDRVLGGGHKAGRPTVLSEQTEKLIVKSLVTCMNKYMNECMKCMNKCMAWCLYLGVCFE